MLQSPKLPSVTDKSDQSGGFQDNNRSRRDSTQSESPLPSHPISIARPLFDSPTTAYAGSLPAGTPVNHVSDELPRGFMYSLPRMAGSYVRPNGGDLAVRICFDPMTSSI